MNKLLIALLLVSGSALADPPRNTAEINSWGRTVGGSSCSSGYCTQYDSMGRTVGGSSYTPTPAAPAVAPVYIPESSFNKNDPWASTWNYVINQQR